MINIGSIDGIHVPVLESYSYSASKAAVHQLTRHLAKRLAPTITVNAVAPGPFESKMMAATLEAFGDQIAEAAPLKRIGRPDDMAGVAIFLASRAGAYVTGADHPGRRGNRHHRLRWHRQRLYDQIHLGHRHGWSSLADKLLAVTARRAAAFQARAGRPACLAAFWSVKIRHRSPT